MHIHVPLRICVLGSLLTIVCVTQAGNNIYFKLCKDKIESFLKKQNTGEIDDVISNYEKIYLQNVIDKLNNNVDKKAADIINEICRRRNRNRRNADELSTTPLPSTYSGKNSTYFSAMQFTSSSIFNSKTTSILHVTSSFAVVTNQTVVFAVVTSQSTSVLLQTPSIPLTSLTASLTAYTSNMTSSSIQLKTNSTSLQSLDMASSTSAKEGDVSKTISKSRSHSQATDFTRQFTSLVGTTIQQSSKMHSRNKTGRTSVSFSDGMMATRTSLGTTIVATFQTPFSTHRSMSSETLTHFPSKRKSDVKETYSVVSTANLSSSQSIYSQLPSVDVPSSTSKVEISTQISPSLKTVSSFSVQTTTYNSSSVLRKTVSETLQSLSTISSPYVSSSSPYITSIYSSSSKLLSSPKLSATLVHSSNAIITNSSSRSIDLSNRTSSLSPKVGKTTFTVMPSHSFTSLTKHPISTETVFANLSSVTDSTSAVSLSESFSTSSIRSTIAEVGFTSSAFDTKESSSVAKISSSFVGAEVSSSVTKGKFSSSAVKVLSSVVKVLSSVVKVEVPTSLVKVEVSTSNFKVEVSTPVTTPTKLNRYDGIMKLDGECDQYENDKDLLEQLLDSVTLFLKAVVVDAVVIFPSDPLKCGSVILSFEIQSRQSKVEIKKALDEKDDVKLEVGSGNSHKIESVLIEEKDTKVTTSLPTTPPKVPTTTPSTRPETNTKDEDESLTTVYIITFSIIGGVILFALFITLLFCRRKEKRGSFELVDSSQYELGSFQTLTKGSTINMYGTDAMMIDAASLDDGIKDINSSNSSKRKKENMYNFGNNLPKWDLPKMEIENDSLKKSSDSSSDDSDGENIGFTNKGAELDGF